MWTIDVRPGKENFVPQALLRKSNLAELITLLLGRQKVVGPVSLGNDQFRFAEINSSAELSLDYLPTILPPKKYFLPPHEMLLHYDIAAGQQMQALAEVEELVLFGVHTCDLAGIQCLNMIFSDRPRDLHYLLRKNHLTLIGLECNDCCDHHANCALLHTHLPKGGYDLFLSDLGADYFVDIATHKGEQLVAAAQLFEPVTAAAQDALATLRRNKKERFKSTLPMRYEDLPYLLEETVDSAIWQQVGEKCLSCGNCTNVCPTCYCFDMVDEPQLDLSKGQRVRTWDSCQHETFAKVAGGESFRAERAARQRHRFNRKFNYPMARYRRLFCTGCGRCSRACMAAIDVQETLKALIEERGR
ncbi:MAG: 4Fe-4S dicluster domain-containing protein [Desulfuromonadales bacterium]|nr:4Fe-4S dicluster domain-containing protein [Desulfuromonadales bacterium]